MPSVKMADVMVGERGRTKFSLYSAIGTYASRRNNCQKVMMTQLNNVQSELSSSITYLTFTEGNLR
jgi:hypothetical protein